jgi:C1A family cysteine protease
MSAVSRGVVSIAIEADKTIFQHYKSGVIDSAECGKRLDHGVAAVGYNSQAFIVRNSWGPSWGDNG